MEAKTISTPSWLHPLQRNLKRPGKGRGKPRLAVIGIGQELNGDDGAGPATVHALQNLLAGQTGLCLIDAGPAPENFTGTLRRFNPDTVLLIDAAEIAAVPGTVRILDWRMADGWGASAHTLPLSLFADFLEAEVGCEVILIGIQPASTQTGARLSPLVHEGVETLARELSGLFRSGRFL